MGLIIFKQGILCRGFEMRQRIRFAGRRGVGGRKLIRDRSILGLILVRARCMNGKMECTCFQKYGSYCQ